MQIENEIFNLHDFKFNLYLNVDNYVVKVFL